MRANEEVLIEEVFTFLTQVTSNPPSPTSITLGKPHIEVIVSILDRWPAAQRFPGACCTQKSFESIYIDILMVVMDLGRLVVAHCATTPATPRDREKFFDCLFTAADWSSFVSSETPVSKPHETNVLLLMRTIANYFQESIPINDGRWVHQVKKCVFFSTYFFPDLSTRS